jgi:hypothetical protein
MLVLVVRQNEREKVLVGHNPSTSHLDTHSYIKKKLKENENSHIN